METHKRPQIVKAILRKKNGSQEESTFLTSEYTTKLQSSRQYGIAQRQKYRSMEQNRKPRNKLMHLWVPYF